jgi:hypothetical protein
MKPVPKYAPFICLFLLMVQCVFAVPALARDDWQYWNNFQLKAPIYKELRLQVAGEQRIRDDFSDLFLANVSAGLLWQPYHFLEFGPFYKFEHEKSSSGKRTDENRYYLEASLKWKRWGFKFKDRSRGEYRNIAGEDAFRYRNQFKIAYPLEIKKLQVTPYMSNEIFYDGDKDEWNQNRFISGLTFRLTRFANVSVYYMLRSKRSGHDWDEFNVLGSNFSLSF